jgi:hypothetical protein
VASGFENSFQNEPLGSFDAGVLGHGNGKARIYAGANEKTPA